MGEEEKAIFHSVTLITDKCKGCTNCLKQCPTEAIRVRDGKAKIIKERCIDCGMCIKVCPYHAKNAITDEINKIKEYKHAIALPAPTLYGQFKNGPSVDLILTGLLQIGFHEVFEVARAAELVTIATKEFLHKEKIKKPVISSACPAVVRLIIMRFPNLIDHILPLLSPMEIAAKLAREQAMQKHGLKSEEIGIFFITPCAAKVTCAKAPIGQIDAQIDGCIALKDVYIPLVTAMKMIKAQPLTTSSAEGITWARNGGETYALKEKKRIAVDGIHNVIKVLEEVEDDQLNDLAFIEASSCTSGCIGGPLTVENTFITKTRIQALELCDNEPDNLSLSLSKAKWSAPIQYHPVSNFDTDMSTAIHKLEQMNEIENRLPGLDCGSCGAPSCLALAEDVVLGHAIELDCIFKLREKIDALANEMVQLNKLGIGHGNQKENSSVDQK